MAYTALVGLGSQIGVGITSVKLYQCGNNCTSCTPITNYTNVAVSSFNSPGLSVTGITDGTTCIKAEPVGVCSGSTQCIIISGIPGPTPSPTVPLPTPTASSTAPAPTASTTAPAPTASATAPAPTPTPSATALPGCGSTVTGTYNLSGFTTQTVNLNFSGAINGGLITVHYTANSRPDRFTIKKNGLSIVANSGWVGSDSNYSGPWDLNGIEDADGDGYMTFTYDNSATYQLLVDVGNANPSNILDDSWSVTFSCGTPTPTPTATPNYYNVKVKLVGMMGTQGNLTVYQSSDSITFTSSVTITTTDNDVAQQFFNGTPGYYYYFIVARTSGNSNRLNWYTEVSPSDFSPGSIEGAGCTSLNGATLQSDTFQLPNPVQSVSEVLFYGDISDGCL